MRAIDAYELKRSLAVSALIEDQKTLEQIIDEQPTIEERKKGKWIVNTYEHAREFWDRETTCSVCGYKMGGGTPNYCPNCGARMER